MDSSPTVAPAPGKAPPHRILIVDDDPVVSGMLGVSVPLLETAKEIAFSHQEKWDGSGYPEGLAGEAIPLSARLMAVADVYDALISHRVYKQAIAHEQAAKIIAEGRGTQFDPDIANAFDALQAEFQAIAARFADQDEHLAALEARAQRAALE